VGDRAEAIRIRPYDVATDAAWAESFLDERLGGRWQARRGELLDVLSAGLGLVSEVDGGASGLLTWRLEDDPSAVELSAMAVEPRGQGQGTTLVRALIDAVRAAGRRRIRVVTTNDNLDALVFYQHRGFRLVELRPGALDEARRTLKPQIPRLGQHGIPMRDELELELVV
jgi:GNAT superfamily N-acetyltransferase